MSHLSSMDWYLLSRAMFFGALGVGVMAFAVFDRLKSAVSHRVAAHVGAGRGVKA